MTQFKKMIRSARSKLGFFLLPGDEWQAFYERYGNIPRFKRDKIKFRAYSFETPDVPSVLWQIKENFIDHQLEFKSEKTDPLIIDCGANVGVTCAYFKSIYPKSKIKAYEADPEIFGYLRKNVEENKIERDVELINKAVWTGHEGVWFAREGADGGSIYSQTKNKIKVESVRLKEIIQSEKGVDFLKIDIEGAEDAALIDCGETLQKVRYIFLEYHSNKNRRQNLDMILKTLSENDFRYKIQTFGKAKTFMTSDRDDNEFDLQLLVYAVNTKK